MKTQPIDFILSSIFITIIVVLDFALIYFIANPTYKILCGDYHALLSCLTALFIYGIISGIMINLLIRIRPLQMGEFPMSHPNFTYWKLLTVITHIGEFALKPFTTVFTKPLILKLFGAKLGKDVAIGGTVEDPFLISAGDYSIIGLGSLVTGNASLNGNIIFGKVDIGKQATISINSIVMPNTKIGNQSVLSIGSVLLSGTQIPDAETWKGSPARKWQSNQINN